MESIRPRTVPVHEHPPAIPAYRALLPRIGAVIGAVALSCLLALRWLGTSTTDTLTIAAFLLFSGGVSIAIGWLAIRYTRLRMWGCAGRSWSSARSAPSS